MKFEFQEKETAPAEPDPMAIIKDERGFANLAREDFNAARDALLALLPEESRAAWADLVPEVAEGEEPSEQMISLLLALRSQWVEESGEDGTPREKRAGTPLQRAREFREKWGQFKTAKLNLAKLADRPADRDLLLAAETFADLADYIAAFGNSEMEAELARRLRLAKRVRLSDAKPAGSVALAGFPLW